MPSIDLLVRDIAFARRCSSIRLGGEIPGRAAGIIEEARKLSREEADLGDYLARVEFLLKKFRTLFPSCRNVFLLRAPGRINLIGEHTDYNGLPVLPIAINRDILLVGATRHDAIVEIHNVDSRFPDRSFKILDQIEPYPWGDWGNYAKAAAQSLPGSSASGVNPPSGFNCVLDGNIPMASGLASSSAIVVAFALALLAANERHIPRRELAELLACGEHYVGSRGGGMDQTVCLMAEEGKALKIEFFPIRTRQIPLPAGYTFVVCHSTVSSSKASGARPAYNLRSAESRIAAALLGKSLSGHVASKTVSTRPPALGRIGDLYSHELDLSEADIDLLAERTFVKETYSLSGAADLLGLSEEQLLSDFFGSFRGEELQSLGELKLRRRFRHVISEGRRVRKAAEELRSGNMHEFGRLMYGSHESCASDYEISVPELDALVSIAKEAGALGSRLTGAGFGGCTVSLVQDSNVRDFMDKIEKGFYGGYLSKRKPQQDWQSQQTEHMFTCKAVSAAGDLFA